MCDDHTDHTGLCRPHLFQSSLIHSLLWALGPVQKTFPAWYLLVFSIPKISFSFSFHGTPHTCAHPHDVVMANQSKSINSPKSRRKERRMKSFEHTHERRLSLSWGSSKMLCTNPGDCPLEQKIMTTIVPYVLCTLKCWNIIVTVYFCAK